MGADKTTYARVACARIADHYGEDLDALLDAEGDALRDVDALVAKLQQHVSDDDAKAAGEVIAEAVSEAFSDKRRWLQSMVDEYAERAGDEY